VGAPTLSPPEPSRDGPRRAKLDGFPRGCATAGVGIMTAAVNKKAVKPPIRSDEGRLTSARNFNRWQAFVRRAIPPAALAAGA